MKKQSLKDKKGITLIALVVTIVVLLILAGVSISMLTGENGIITQAKGAKEVTRGGEVKEAVEMAVNENKMIDYTTGRKKGKQDVIDELVANKKLTEEEVNALETEDKITIGGIEIDFSKLEKKAPGVLPPESDEPSVTDIIYYGNLNTGIITNTMPSIPTNKDVYLKGDYIYIYSEQNQGWSVVLATAEQGVQSYIPDYKIVDRNQISYEEILTEVCGKPIVDLSQTFANCTNLTTAPYVPNTVKYMYRTFYNCTSLTGEVKIDAFPSEYEECFGNVDFVAQNLTLTGIAKIGVVFVGRTGLNYNYEIPDPLPSGGYYFNLMTGIVYEGEMPEYPNHYDVYLYGDYIYIYVEKDKGWNVGLATEEVHMLTEIYPDYPVTNINEISYDEILTEVNGVPIVALNQTFYDCKNLITAPEIPSTVVSMDKAFKNCTALTAKPTLPSGVITEESNIFEGCTQFGY